MKISMGAARRTFAATAMCVLIALPTLIHAGEHQTGVVRIVNPNAFVAIIYAEEFDYFGNAKWKSIGLVRKNYAVEFPNVPEGARMGVDAQKGALFWGPFTVTYFKGGFRLFTYTLDPKQ